MALGASGHWLGTRTGGGGRPQPMASWTIGNIVFHSYQNHIILNQIDEEEEEEEEEN